MSHELDTTTGDAAFVEIGERVTAWHGKGNFIRPSNFGLLSTKEKIERILELGRLGWDVEKNDIFDVRGSMIRGWKSFERSDTNARMGVFPESYTILQNRELFELVEPMMDAGIFQFDTAGAIKDGQDVWALFKFNPQDAAVREYFEKENITLNALLANNHSYKRLVTIMETPIRVVCKNTLAAATGAFGGRKRRAGRYPGAVLLRHTKNVKSLSVDAVQELWGELTSRYAAVAHSYETLKQRYLDEEEFDANVLDVLAPLPEDPTSKQFDATMNRAMERRMLVTRLYRGEGLGIDGEPTAWNAYNAAVEAVDHYDEQFKVRTTRLQALFPGGSLANKKQDVLNNLYALTLNA